MAPTRFVIGLGSNLGDRLAILSSAALAISRTERVLGASAVYESEAWGGPTQGRFLNAALGVESHATPRELLERLLGIERDHGRIRRELWGPRSLDLDLLLGESRVEEPGLSLPHPRLAERTFALVPLLEVMPDACAPEGTPRYADLVTTLSEPRLTHVAGSDGWAALAGIPRVCPHHAPR